MEKHIRNQYIAKLKEAIAQNSQKGVLLRIDAFFEKGIEKHKLHIKKRWVGYDTRRYLLAYAYLRNIPYKVCESKTHDVLDPSSILYAVKGLEIELDRENIRDWISGEEIQKEVA